MRIPYLFLLLAILPATESTSHASIQTPDFSLSPWIRATVTPAKKLARQTDDEEKRSDRHQGLMTATPTSLAGNSVATAQHSIAGCLVQRLDLAQDRNPHRIPAESPLRLLAGAPLDLIKPPECSRN